MMPVGRFGSKVMLVGEYPDFEAMRKNEAVAGSVHFELSKMLGELGHSIGEVLYTNVLTERPNKPSPKESELASLIAFKKKDRTPEHIYQDGLWVRPKLLEGVGRLSREIELHNPDIIIALGNLPLWALAGKWSIAKWRGSMLTTSGGTTHKGIKLLPTYPIKQVFTQYELRPIVLHDLGRAFSYVGKPWPTTEWKFQIQPSLGETIDTLQLLRSKADAGPLLLSVDIETRAYNIACLGIAWTTSNAICIPLIYAGDKDYWSPEEEAHVTYLLYRLLTHPNVKCIGQNFIYDCQYLWRSWHYIPNFGGDTMLAQHVLYPEMQKSLDFICSLRNEQYVFWKDDGKTLDVDGDDRKHWAYNCEDCVRTLEAWHNLMIAIKERGLEGPNEQQQATFIPVLKMMNRGVRVDYDAQRRLGKELTKAWEENQAWIETAVGHPLNLNSPKQMQDFFYHELQLPKQYSKGPDKRVTCDAVALAALAAKQPLLKPLMDRIEEQRSIKVFTSNFLADKRDIDGRLRCSFNIAGTSTYRFSSSENAFGSGLNLQTIPKGDEQ